VAVPIVAVDHLTNPAGDNGVYWLDHGAAVPLHFLLPLLPEVKVVLLGYSLQPRATHQAFGRQIREAWATTGRRAVFVASGERSRQQKLHPVAKTGPSLRARRREKAPDPPCNRPLTPAQATRKHGLFPRPRQPFAKWTYGASRQSRSGSKPPTSRDRCSLSPG